MCINMYIIVKYKYPNSSESHHFILNNYQIKQPLAFDRNAFEKLQIQ